jgi:hypothetical protein
MGAEHFSETFCVLNVPQTMESVNNYGLMNWAL